MEDGLSESEVVFEEDVWELEDEEGDRPPEDSERFICSV